ncbi:acyltransferase [Amycolatopsis sp. 195334CR]|nr:acyltransferase [Amycolatopsis sp. 195334CR]
MPAGARGASPRRYRPELQGLRAIAVVLVVVYHVWLGRISGGVDVFFLISGFLLTGQLVRARARGPVRFRQFWGKVLKRLLPAALTVLLAVIAASVLLLPEARWFQTIREVFASALFLENWRLAIDSADYFTQHDQSSVVQHFWSLSIQGQFYLVWPLLIALVARRFLTTTLVVVFAGSLAFSVVLTAIDQPLAYFHSLTRVWEFALGGLLALVIDKVPLHRWARVLLGWLGIAGLISCGLVLTVGEQFPGYVALWPLLSAVAVLLAGASGSSVGADRFLASRPMTYVGDISYALYLWHWPILVFYLVARGRTEIGIAGGLGIIALSAGLAVLTYHFVENPARQVRVRTYRFAAIAMVPVLLATGGWQVAARWKADSYALSAGDPDYPGARAHTPGFEYWGAPDPPLTPAFLSLPEEYAATGDCETSPRHEELSVCSTEFHDPPSKRIVVAGDSHSQQFIAALRPVAEQKNWQIISMLRGGCPFSTDSESVPGDQPCMDWNAAVAEEITEIGPDAVFTVGTRDARPGLVEWTPPGYVAQWRKIAAAGIPVLAVRDNPRYNFSPSACVDANGPAAPECATPRADLFAPEPPYLGLDDVPPEVSFLDFSDYFCDPVVCPPVIGNVLLYLDDNHVTATYMSTMAPMVEEAVETALGWATADAPS